MDQQLSPVACVKFGWETFKKRPWFIIGATFIVGILSFSFNFKAESYGEFAPLLSYMIAGGLILWAIRMAAEILFTRFLLQAHDSVETMKYIDALPPRPYWKYIGGKIAVAVVVTIGFLLLIVPGVIASLAFLFTPFLIVERKLWPIEAMKESARITKGYRWNLFYLWLLVIGLNILGFFALFIGLLVTIPVSMLAVAHAFRMLERQANAATATV